MQHRQEQDPPAALVGCRCREQGEGVLPEVLEGMECFPHGAVVRVVVEEEERITALHARVRDLLLPSRPSLALPWHQGPARCHWCKRDGSSAAQR